MAFLDENYLLTTESAKAIYGEVGGLPILDPHNHCDVKALAEDRGFSDLWEAEAATDHYVWELMRKCGVEEAFITGKEASNQEKWMALAKVFPLFAGNPTYEWIHLDLRTRLGIAQEINEENALAIWEKSRRKLQTPEFSPQSLILAMNVEAMCSTDDPADSLEYHERLAQSRLAGRVRPTFRPDNAMNVQKSTWNGYVDRLGRRWNRSIQCLDDFLDVLAQGHEAMGQLGAVASDHGVEVPETLSTDRKTAQELFRRARGGESLTAQEASLFRGFFLNEMAELDASRGWVFQIHYGAVRDVRTSLYQKLGADVGGDVSDHNIAALAPLLPLLNRFDGRLKVVLYNMNPAHNATMAMLTRAFGANVCLGPAWWLNDSYVGIRTQLELGASIDLFSNMTGMVSDSRKILSYGSRFDLYRRTLAAVLGDQVERGQMPLSVGRMLARRLSYDRPREFFGFR
ncbi:MAG: glucuronate isomerase [Oligosphaeraceae bacterium]